jgi:hypothetical protein
LSNYKKSTKTPNNPSLAAACCRGFDRVKENIMHTKGKWEVKKQKHPTHSPFEIVVSKDKSAIGWAYGGNAEAEANAHLIAAAPDLLSVLKSTMEQACLFCEINCPENQYGCVQIKEAVAAIAKATNP